jgi:hypothetical protein
LGLESEAFFTNTTWIKQKINEVLSLSQITYREWTAVSLIGGLILAIVATNFIGEMRVKKVFKQTNAQMQNSQKMKIDITLIGALESPGTYAFFPGISLREVFKEVSLAKNADRKKIDFRRIIYHSETIEIPYKTKRSKVGNKKNVEQKKSATLNSFLSEG